MRVLRLNRETLTALTSDELSSVAGGSHLCTVGHGPSFDQSCPTPTLPVNDCLADISRNMCA